MSLRNKMSRTTRVIPAILTSDQKALLTMIRQAERFASYVQFDIMDGRFVPSRSITHDDLAAIHTDLTWEAHLMVQEPGRFLEGYKKAGAHKVVFHYEATSSPRDVISQARQLGLKVGLALNPETQTSTILSLVGEIDSVLFLTVHPGFYGSKFIPEVLDKVACLHQSHPEIEIGVDGGINATNIGQVARLGVDSVYVGSAIFLQPDPTESFHGLVALARQT